MTQEREAFEAWAKQYGRIFLNTKPKLGRSGVMYENQFTQEAWVGWSARASLAQPASVPDLYERLAEAHDASLDDDHRACRVILTEIMSLLAAAPQAQPAPAVPAGMPASFPGAASHLADELKALLEKCRPGYVMSKGTRRQLQECSRIADAIRHAAQAAPQPEAADNCEISDKARIAMLEALVADREKSLRKLRAAAAPQPEAQPHSLVSDRDYLRIFEAARHGSSAPVGMLRGIRACIAAYEAAAPSVQAEPTTAMGHVHKDAAQRMDAFYQAFNGKQAEQGGE